MAVPLLGRTVLGTLTAPTARSIAPDYYWKWRVIWYHKSGGIKRDWFLGQNSGNIVSIDFENNLKGCGAGKIALGEIDFPVDSDDYILIYYEGSVVYRAIVDNSIESTIGEIDIKLIPYHQRLKEVLYAGSFTGKKIYEIIQTIVNDSASYTGITYNSSAMDAAFLADATTYTIEYFYEEPQKIFDDLIKKAGSYEWGVTVDNIFTVYAKDSTVTDLYLQGETPNFTDLDYKKNYEDFGATRYQVYYKNGDSSESVRAGQVGYGAGYATLAAESLVRRKEEKKEYSVPFASAAEALALAYSELTAKVIPESITVKNVNLDNVSPYIGQRITVETPLQRQLYNFIACDSVTGWDGATLDSTDYVENSDPSGTGGSVYFTGSTAGNYMQYYFTSRQRPFKASKLLFMVKSTLAGDYLEVSLGSALEMTYSASTYSTGEYSEGDLSATSTLWGTTYGVNIVTGGVWQLVELDISSDTSITNGILYFGIRLKSTPASSVTVHLDRVQFLMYTRNQYTANIVQKKVKIDEKGVACDIVLSSYDQQSEKKLFNIDKRLQYLETIATNTV